MADDDPIDKDNKEKDGRPSDICCKDTPDGNDGCDKDDCHNSTMSEGIKTDQISDAKQDCEKSEKSSAQEENEEMCPETMETKEIEETEEILEAGLSTQVSNDTCQVDSGETKHTEGDARTETSENVKENENSENNDGKSGISPKCPETEEIVASGSLHCLECNTMGCDCSEKEKSKNESHDCVSERIEEQSSNDLNDTSETMDTIQKDTVEVQRNSNECVLEAKQTDEIDPVAKESIENEESLENVTKKASEEKSLESRTKEDSANTDNGSDNTEVVQNTEHSAIVEDVENQGNTDTALDIENAILDTELDTPIPPDNYTVTSGGYALEPSTTEMDTIDCNDLDLPIPANPGFAEDCGSEDQTDDYYEEVNVKKDRSGSDLKDNEDVTDSSDIRTSTPIKTPPSSKSSPSLSAIASPHNPNSHLIGNPNLMGSTSSLLRTKDNANGGGVVLRRSEEREVTTEEERGRSPLIRSSAISSSQPALGTMSKLKKIRSSIRMPTFRKQKSERKSSTTFKDEVKAVEEELQPNVAEEVAPAPKVEQEEVKMRKKSQPSSTVQSRMSSMFKRFSMGNLNMDVSRVKGKDSAKYRSSESLESFSSSTKSGQGSMDNLDKRQSASRESSISQNQSLEQSRCNSIDELDEGLYDTVDGGSFKDKEKFKEKLLKEKEFKEKLLKEKGFLGSKEKLPESNMKPTAENESTVSPRLKKLKSKEKLRPKSSIELGAGRYNLVDSNTTSMETAATSLSHNELGYALVERRGSNMVTIEDKIEEDKDSKGIYLLASALQEEYSEPKDKRPDGAPLERGWDGLDERDYREPCDSLTDSFSKSQEMLGVLENQEKEEEEEEVYEEIEIGEGVRTASVKKRKLLRSNAEDDEQVDGNVRIDTADELSEEEHYEEIPDRNPLDRQASNPYNSIVDSDSKLVDPYATIKDLTTNSNDDSNIDSPPTLPPKPGMEPPYENSPRLHTRGKKLPPLPSDSANSSSELPPPVPPRNSTYFEHHENYENVSKAPPRPPRISRASSNASSEKRVSLSRRSSAGVDSMGRGSTNSYDDDEDLCWDEDEWSDDQDGDEGDGAKKEVDEEEIYANIQPFEGEEIEAKDKLHHIVHELMATEQVYVEKLEMLNKTRSQTSTLLGADIAREIFPNINSMCKLHREYILPHLVERDNMWKSNKKVGDIMKYFCPYLKLYTDYVKNFDHTMALLEHWKSKSREFAQMLKTVQIKSASHSMRIQIKAHMLEPITRVPRYELLLNQYLKYLPPDSDDRSDVEMALKSVSEAALHFESMMNHEDQMGKMMELQKQLDMPIGVFSTTRHLIKEGRLYKVHATSGKLAQRYVFLLNDKLTLCKEKQYYIPGMAKYNVKAILDLDGMEVLNGDDIEAKHTFYIKTKEKAIELAGSTTDEKAEWQQAIWRAVEERMRAKLSRKTYAEGPVSRNPRLTLIETGMLGKEAPILVHNSQVSMCMLCAKDFSPFTRKHHCLACGAVICSSCSQRELHLEYKKGKERVCDECYQVLTQIENTSVHRSSLRNFKKRSQEICMHRGFMYIMPDDKTTFTRRWFEIHEEGTLYVYKAQQDIRAMAYLPLGKVEQEPAIVSLDGETVIRLEKEGKIYYLKDDTVEALVKWQDNLKAAIYNARGTSRRGSNDSQSTTDTASTISSETSATAELASKAAEISLKPPEFRPVRKNSSKRRSVEFSDDVSELTEEEEEREDKETLKREEGEDKEERLKEEEEGSKTEDTLDMCVRLDDNCSVGSSEDTVLDGETDAKDKSEIERNENEGKEREDSDNVEKDNVTKDETKDNGTKDETDNVTKDETKDNVTQDDTQTDEKANENADENANQEEENSGTKADDNLMADNTVTNTNTKTDDNKDNNIDSNTDNTTIDENNENEDASVVSSPDSEETSTSQSKMDDLSSTSSEVKSIKESLSSSNVSWHVVESPEELSDFPGFPNSLTKAGDGQDGKEGQEGQDGQEEEHRGLEDVKEDTEDKEKEELRSSYTVIDTHEFEEEWVVKV